MADTLIENILAKEPHSPTATIVPDKHTIITSLPEIQGNHETVIPDPLNPFGRWRQKVGISIKHYSISHPKAKPAKQRYRYHRL